MKVTIHPLSPLIIESDKITVLTTNNQDIYLKVINGILGREDSVVVANEKYDLLEMSKAFLWLGDSFLDIDLNKLFQAQLIKKLSASLSEEHRKKMFELNSEMKSLVLDAAFMLDLPLRIDEEWDVSKIIKYCNLKYSVELNRDPYGIIEGVIRTASELNEQRIITMLNVSHYLSINQLDELVSLVEALNLKLFIIEFSEQRDFKKYDKCRYYHVDHDYVEWEYNI